MEDSRAIELYARFRLSRRQLGLKYTYAEYHDFLRGSGYPMNALPFVEIADEQVREVANFVNDFCRYLHDLRAWKPVLTALDQDQQLEVLVEFLLPICLFCFSAPYALKGKLHTSIAKISHQAKIWTDTIIVHESVIQKAVKEARLRAGIANPAGPHTLRHFFATHLLEDGYDIRTVQELLSHTDVSATMICTHVLNRGERGVRSPVDGLAISVPPGQP